MRILQTTRLLRKPKAPGPEPITPEYNYLWCKLDKNNSQLLSTSSLTSIRLNKEARSILSRLANNLVFMEFFLPLSFFLCSLLWWNCPFKYSFFHRLQLSMEHHGQVGINALPHSDFLYEGSCHNPDSHSWSRVQHSITEISRYPSQSRWQSRLVLLIWRWIDVPIATGYVPSLGIYKKEVTKETTPNWCHWCANVDSYRI